MSTFQYTKKETLLKTEGITLKFGDNLILRDVNVEIKDIVRPDCVQGQIVGFLGPSGIGKSQFAEILTGLRTPGIHTDYTLNGHVLISEHKENLDLSDVEAGHVGFVQQNYPLFKYMTVLNNLKVGASKSGLSKAEQKEKVEYYLDKMNLLEHKNKYPAQLSGGQKQRVAIAQQLLCSKNFLVLDEPFSGLDINMIDKVCSLLQLVASLDERNTVIVISHDITATVSIADTLWLMGREKDSDGKTIPGARIVQEIDLIERGLAWEKEITLKKEFSDTCREIRGIFPKLG